MTLEKFVVQNRWKIRIYVILRRNRRERSIQMLDRPCNFFLEFFFLIYHSSLHFERKHPRVSIVFLLEYWLRKTRKVRYSYKRVERRIFWHAEKRTGDINTINILECSCIELNFNHLIIAYWILSTIVVEK